MDAQPSPTVTPAVPASPKKNLLAQWADKFNSLPKKQKILAGIFILVLAGALIWLLVAGSKSDSPDTIIAKVGDTPIPQRFLELELDYYPGTPSAEVRQMLTQKIINDEVSLQAAKSEGIIQTSLNLSASPTSEEYLARTNQVQIIRNTINQQAVNMEAEVVSIWFYNNGYIGPLGYDKGREMALRKITPIYDQVKNKQITLKRAGELITSDKELIDSRMNVSLVENSYILLKGRKGEQISFWPEFDKKLWQLNPGELTEIFTGTDIVNGKTMPILYAFGQVTKKTEESTSNYDQWLATNKTKYEIVY